MLRAKLRPSLKSAGSVLGYVAIGMVIDQCCVRMRSVDEGPTWTRVSKNSVYQNDENESTSLRQPWPNMDWAKTGQPSDRLWSFIDRWTYSFRACSYPIGSLVVYTCPSDPKMQLVGRIIALGGDKVRPLPYARTWRVDIPHGSCWIEAVKPLNQTRQSKSDTEVEVPVDSNILGPIPLGIVEGRVLMQMNPLPQLPGRVLTQSQRARVRFRGVPDYIN